MGLHMPTNDVPLIGAVLKIFVVSSILLSSQTPVDEVGKPCERQLPINSVRRLMRKGQYVQRDLKEPLNVNGGAAESGGVYKRYSMLRNTGTASQ